MKSKDYGWRYITASQLISDKPCELLFIYASPSAFNNSVVIYDGQSDVGDVVNTPWGYGRDGTTDTMLLLPIVFNPPVPVRLSKGLYIKLSNINNAFIQFRILKEGE